MILGYDISPAKVLAGSLSESGAIVRTFGFKLAALAPFAMLIFGFIAVYFMASQQAYKSLIIQTGSQEFTENIVADLERSLGPKADKTKLRNPQHGFFVPTMYSKELGFSETETLIRINKDTRTIERLQGTLPPHLKDVLELSILRAQLQTDDEPTISYSLIGQPVAQPLDFATQLIWLLTVAFSTAAGAIAAASTHALSTAYLQGQEEEVHLGLNAHEDLLSKIIGIGAAYSALILPWAIVGGGALAFIGIFGTGELSDAAVKVGLSALDPMRLFLFGLCTISGYALYASLVLTLASRTKTAAGARTLTGPVTALAIAPAPIAMAFAANMDGLIFQLMTWFPLTAPTSIQLGFGSLDIWDLIIRTSFLVFVSLTVISWSLALIGRSVKPVQHT